MKLLLENWRKYLNESKLRVFDFDDTLAMTDSMIILNKASGEQIKQTPGEWAVYKPEPGDEFDYSEIKPDKNDTTVSVMREIKPDPIQYETGCTGLKYNTLK